jgi:predicted  nucleic acid-binding Zn-ribbon protein
MPKAGSKRCPKCGNYFDPRGIKRHMAGCKGILDKMKERKAKKAAKKKATKKKAAKKKAAKKKAHAKPKEFLVAAFEYEDVRVVSAEGLDDAIDELLVNDVPRKDIEIFEIARMLKIDQIINIKREFVLKEV